VNNCLIFNHHSLPLSSPSQVAQAMPEFLKICLKANRLGLKTILLDQGQDTHWFRLELAPNYFWQNWHDEIAVRGELREQVRAFRRIATQQPLFATENADSDLALFDACEMSSAQSYSALRAAAWYGAPLTSFPTRQPWDNSPVAVVIYTVDERGEHEHTTTIINLYSLAVLSAAEADLIAARDAAIRSGKDIWNRHEELFPNLEFCGKVQSQLYSWGHQSSPFKV